MLSAIWPFSKPHRAIGVISHHSARSHHARIRYLARDTRHGISFSFRKLWEFSIQRKSCATTSNSMYLFPLSRVDISAHSMNTGSLCCFVLSFTAKPLTRRDHLSPASTAVTIPCYESNHTAPNREGHSQCRHGKVCSLDLDWRVRDHPEVDQRWEDVRKWNSQQGAEQAQNFCQAVAFRNGDEAQRYYN